jgi:hypothetical protein
MVELYTLAVESPLLITLKKPYTPVVNGRGVEFLSMILTPIYLNHLFSQNALDFNSLHLVPFSPEMGCRGNNN